jgi:flavin-dependent dehydrogenase
MTLVEHARLPQLSAHVWDAVVVGAGPAGALAARGLAAAGVRVLLVDRATFPRPKVCGCCLSRRALAVLDQCGLLPHVTALQPHAYDRLQVAAGRSRTTLELPAGLSVSRERLDLALVEQAVAAGARFAPGVSAIMEARSHSTALPALRLEKPGEGSVHVTCRVVVDAAGLGTGFARCELDGESISTTSRVGASAALETGASDWKDGTINMAIGAEGYVGAVRLDDRRWNLAAALDIDAVRRRRGIAPVVTRILDSVGWRIGEAANAVDWRGTPRLSRRPTRVASTRLFAIGDAAGYVEPFTGEGMACALEGGRAVVALTLRAIGAWDPAMAATWTSIVRIDIQRRLTLPALAAWSVRRPRLAAGITSLLAVWPDIATPAINRASAAGERIGGRL